MATQTTSNRTGATSTPSLAFERFAGVCEVVTVPPLCPLATTTYDFSQSADLIHRAEGSTTLWLQTDGLHRLGTPPALLAHRHDD